MALISICIPAYKNAVFFQRLLESVAVQTFTDFEVIVTDDSPGNEVMEVCQKFSTIKSLQYYKNASPLGSPENWNEAIRKATGAWIKIMHHDDWFVHKHVLMRFYIATVSNAQCGFFFSAFKNINYADNSEQKVTCTAADLFFLRLSPLHLFKKVYIGNPSCTLVRRSANLLYDKDFKWVVDFDYYIRYIQKFKEWHYIPEILINVGFHSEQVTQDCFRNPNVEIPESHSMLEKHGLHILRNPVVYDYYWRLYRNVGVRNIQDVTKYTGKNLHPILSSMIRSQQKHSLKRLSQGIFSKTLMGAKYIQSLFIPIK